MQSHPYSVLNIKNGSKLLFTPCPGTKEVNLADSISTLKAAGVSMIITLLDDAELATHGVATLPSQSEVQGIQWVQLPIVDDQGPSEIFEAKWRQYKDRILSLLVNKGIAAVHCKGGTGRTGLVIGLLLQESGYSKADALTAVQSVKPKALINSAQRSYFDNY
jgi:protein-tyrosine phosphatase